MEREKTRKKQNQKDKRKEMVAQFPRHHDQSATNSILTLLMVTRSPPDRGTRVTTRVSSPSASKSSSNLVIPSTRVVFDFFACL
ncbi:hypothetical protein OIU76_019366 [Salix suchowensis]|nr:hypothetical protein OIU76_019366 [Salix suchowensis]